MSTVMFCQLWMWRHNAVQTLSVRGARVSPSSLQQSANKPNHGRTCSFFWGVVIARIVELCTDLRCFICARAPSCDACSIFSSSSRSRFVPTSSDSSDAICELGNIKNGQEKAETNRSKRVSWLSTHHACLTRPKASDVF